MPDTQSDLPLFSKRQWSIRQLVYPVVEINALLLLPVNVNPVIRNASSLTPLYIPVSLVLIALAANLKSEEREEFADLLEKAEEQGYLPIKEYNRFFMYFKIAKKRCPKESYARKALEDFETKVLNKILEK